METIKELLEKMEEIKEEKQRNKNSMLDKLLQILLLNTLSGKDDQE
jgi:hypothetical protein